ncbi:hypothetical protein [Borrelia miyamotoi]|uniref:hypothetical protein n=1 Tax=Borrelia miyamotoi TaxID=47466 RepID=UPI00041E41CF|nr:hypothetical protein [Borrelia miyamotoi]
MFNLSGINLSLFQRYIDGKIYFKRDGVMILLVMNGEIYINDDFFLKKGESLFVGSYNEGLLIYGNVEILLQSFYSKI